MSPEPDGAAEALAHGTATLYEASGLDCALDPAIRPAWPGARLAGPAYPVTLHPADNLPLHRMLERISPGEVAVVDAGGAPHGFWGEVLAVAAQVRGVAGLVIDGGVRDVDRLAELGFPVFSRWISVRRTAKHDPGRLGVPAVVGGVPVRHGDLVVGDTDGVVVLPRDEVAATLDSARRRVAKEADYLRRIRDGEATMDLYGFRDGAEAP
ncbi:RraA family protein [Rhizohabitans arisaemae]|uniref:RraA family protein n=1 Tax=Rhizohabitans arisaemae TaxID=2720610 RepID=UPI0024B0BCF4|nr:dimethylmenaquinone methyltransferase [Rhizohabitans arisaemae]